MTIFIPTPLRPHAGGKDAVEVAAATIAQALDALTQTHPDLRKHLFTAEGKVRAFVNLYLNDEDVRYLPAKEATAVTSADTLSIIPSIAGGLAVQAMAPEAGLAVQAMAPAAGLAVQAEAPAARRRRIADNRWVPQVSILRPGIPRTQSTKSHED